MPSFLVLPSGFEPGFCHRMPQRGGKLITGIKTLWTSTSLSVPKPHLAALQTDEEQESRARPP